MRVESAVAPKAVMDNNMVYRIERINIFPDYDPLAIRSDSTLVSRLARARCRAS